MVTEAVNGEADRLKRWDRQTYDLLATQDLGLVGVVCESCKRVRPLEAVYTTRETNAHHCFNRADCAATVARNNAPWPGRGGA